MFGNLEITLLKMDHSPITVMWRILGVFFDYEIHFDRQVDSMGKFFLS